MGRLLLNIEQHKQLLPLPDQRRVMTHHHSAHLPPTESALGKTVQSRPITSVAPSVVLANLACLDQSETPLAPVDELLTISTRPSFGLDPTKDHPPITTLPAQTAKSRLILIVKSSTPVWFADTLCTWTLPSHRLLHALSASPLSLLGAAGMRFAIGCLLHNTSSV
jgi:hypothetical protein